MLARLLSRHGYESIVLFSQDPETGEIDPENLTNIPGLHLIDDADILVASSFDSVNCPIGT